MRGSVYHLARLILRLFSDTTRVERHLPGQSWRERFVGWVGDAPEDARLCNRRLTGGRVGSAAAHNLALTRGDTNRLETWSPASPRPARIGNMSEAARHPPGCTEVPYSSNTKKKRVHKTIGPILLRLYRTSKFW